MCFQPLTARPCGWPSRSRYGYELIEPYYYELLVLHGYEYIMMCYRESIMIFTGRHVA